MEMSMREKLLKKIMELGFALDDVGLFLDSHPGNRMALDFFAENQKLYKECVDEYETNYGPLTGCDVNTPEGWTWIQGPWPWELEG